MQQTGFAQSHILRNDDPVLIFREVINELACTINIFTGKNGNRDYENKSSFIPNPFPILPIISLAKCWPPSVCAGPAVTTPPGLLTGTPERLCRRPGIGDFGQADSAAHSAQPGLWLSLLATPRGRSHLICAETGRRRPGRAGPLPGQPWDAPQKIWRRSASLHDV